MYRYFIKQQLPKIKMNRKVIISQGSTFFHKFIYLLNFKGAKPSIVTPTNDQLSLAPNKPDASIKRQGCLFIGLRDWRTGSESASDKMTENEIPFHLRFMKSLLSF